jgi:osmotically-inducible protein OsmY
MTGAIYKQLITKLQIIAISAFLITSLTSCVPMSIIGAGTTTAYIAVQERTLGDMIDDNTIWSRISKGLMRENFRKLYSRITVSVSEGRVLLTGNLEDKQLMLSAVDIAWQTKGVREVVNELTLDKKDHKFKLSKYLSDSWIDTRIKTKILFDRNVSYNNFTIVTYNGIVNVFGIAGSKEELEIVNHAASSTKGVVKVISHARVKSSRTRMKSLRIYKE